MLLKYSKFIFSIVLIFTVSCSSSEHLYFNPNNEYNVNFYFSNQNDFKKEPIHIFVKLTFISGERETHIIVFDQDCSFGEGLAAGHNLQSNKLILKEGSYRLFAETNSNECKLDVVFEITKNQYIYIGYNNNDQLKLIISSSPFLFG